MTGSHPAPPRTIVFISQVYVPDPAAVGQYMADAAVEMARRGHRVVVLTANRGYDDPGVTYPSREVLDGVEVRRLPLSSFGKGSIASRVLGGLLFVMQVVVRGLLMRRLDAILVSTSPPMASLAALVLSRVRNAPIKYWVMDLNPDQMIALNLSRPDSPMARLLDRLNRAVLGRASDVVVLDRFMAERVRRKRDVGARLAIIPPWPHEDHLDVVPHAANPFRERHGLRDKLVIMYSGNHGPSNPLQTLIAAAERLRAETEIVFVFVGGGVGKAEVEAAAGDNVRSLPYQPLAELKYSLSAADVHVVSVGDAVVGIVHPCKVYSAMAVARPVLLVGPRQCHVADIIGDGDIGWHVGHGDVEGAERLLRAIAATDRARLAAMGAQARRLVTERLGKPALCGRFADVLERVPTAEAR